LEHYPFLLEALRLAEERRGFCYPNPSVGAVLAEGNSIIAKGSHIAAGGAHAEVMALNSIERPLDKATLYVTLEPCCHWGKTPPCTDLIIKKGIKKVFYGYRDPNPLVAGKGEQVLLEQGVVCQQIELPEINQFYRSYLHWTLTGRPWVTCKLAMSLDAKIADALGGPVAITGKEAQQLTHQCRLRSDALLTSMKTILADDPSLNVRLEQNVVSKPLYVLDSQLAFPLTARVLKTAATITLFHSVEDPPKIKLLKAKGIKCHQVDRNQDGLDLHQVLMTIGNDGVHDLWVEAGGKLFSSLISKGLANKSIIYVAPTLLGTTAYSAFLEELNLFKSSQKVSWSSIGQDAICEIELA
jgi:diaminohydroxyphosphoribosylaminopyrimidine deaminase/5-amino-6-(5-phosphoribosylamino)uracil reductase